MQQPKPPAAELAEHPVKILKKFSLTVVLSGSEQTGGAFFQSVSSLRALLRLVPESFEVTILDVRGTFGEELNRLTLDAEVKPFKIQALPKNLSTFRDRLLSDSNLFYELLRVALRLFGREVRVSRLARFLDNSSADLVYFVSPVPEAHELQIKPYFWTLWDLFHLDHPEFPELRTSGKFEHRELFNARSIRKASAVVVDSQQLALKAHSTFGAPVEKFIVVPYAVPQSRITILKSDLTKLPAGIGAIAGKYFFYPAQLWTHKNHNRIIEAVVEVVSQGHDIHAVFVGRDHGAGTALEREIQKQGIGDRIHLLGYVQDEAMQALYEASLGLVMASYVGPNIPPLEAMSLKVPIIATNIHKNQLSNAALYFDPDSSEELAFQMLNLMNPKVRRSLVYAGEKRLKEIADSRDSGNALLRERLMKISRRLSLR